jgi:hypothetical protein
MHHITIYIAHNKPQFVGICPHSTNGDSHARRHAYTWQNRRVRLLESVRTARTETHMLGDMPILGRTDVFAADEELTRRATAFVQIDLGL